MIAIDLAIAQAEPESHCVERKSSAIMLQHSICCLRKGVLQIWSYMLSTHAQVVVGCRSAMANTDCLRGKCHVFINLRLRSRQSKIKRFVSHLLICTKNRPNRSGFSANEHKSAKPPQKSYKTLTHKQSLNHQSDLRSSPWPMQR